MASVCHLPSFNRDKRCAVDECTHARKSLLQVGDDPVAYSNSNDGEDGIRFGPVILHGGEEDDSTDQKYEYEVRGCHLRAGAPRQNAEHQQHKEVACDGVNDGGHTQLSGHYKDAGVHGFRVWHP
jgi:hypothetical protein